MDERVEFVLTFNAINFDMLGFSVIGDVKTIEKQGTQPVYFLYTVASLRQLRQLQSEPLDQFRLEDVV